MPGADQVQRGIGRAEAAAVEDARTAAGERPDVIAEAVLDLLDVVESLLGERVLTYAVRKDQPCSDAVRKDQSCSE
ncbi:hypothetical protein [Streptosporangium minutum]|uniref:Uncharacterized protein n=1 Tax=Streptosporangium minutum TaxID=569862 RepID=A0A243RHL1_9ACTN|nr:hypothetical protein [Streptosporangium minutum]OUC94323.1 hypothetical protein CA984_22950 [Streptosporangium minutum]